VRTAPALEHDRDASASPACRTGRRTVFSTTGSRRRASGDERAALPNRAARVLRGYTLLGRRVDVVETSRGCTYDCSFCSIIEMRGRNFHPYSIDRVLADIADARAHGAEAIFLVDDNITLDIERFEKLCTAIVDAGFDDLDYTVQAMTAPLAQHGARLAPLMRRAGFRYVFLGIENILDEDLVFLKARAKNRTATRGRRLGTPASRQSATCTSTACMSSAASSSATWTIRRRRSKPISLLPAVRRLADIQHRPVSARR
jgi:hypothetical protein